MDGLGGHYAKWNKPDKERQILYDITYMWNLKKYNKLLNLTKKKWTHRYREQISGYHCGVGWENGRHKLLGVREAQECIVQHGI